VLRKCKHCDDVNEKSIDTSQNRYLKIGSNYAHFDCHKIYLVSRKKDKLKEEDALIECLRLEDITKKETKEIELKEELFNLLLDYYETPIPNGFFVKIDAITKGKYKGVSNPISYFELVEMYSNKKMMDKLDKLAYDKSLKKEDRLHWDLGCMVNEYPNYVKAKRKKKALEDDSVQAIENIQKYRTNKNQIYQELKKQTEDANKNNTNVDNLVNDLFDI